MEGKLKVTFIDKILFDSGSVEINTNGKKLLSTLAQTLREKKDQMIIIQGHTDNVMIGPDLRKIYPTNWELSAGRSTAVLRYLIENTGIDPQRCNACGYSFYDPVASNLTEEGRPQNHQGGKDAGDTLCHPLQGREGGSPRDRCRLFDPRLQ